MRRLLGAAVCFVLATVVLLNTPLRDRQHDRVIEGEVGKPVGGNELRITVHEVKLAKTLRNGGQEVTSPAVFVVLDVTAEVLRQPKGIDDAELIAGDRTYKKSVRNAGNVRVGTAMVGFPQRGSLIYELPREAIAGTRLRIRDHVTFNISEVIEVPLGLDGDAAVADRIELPERVDPSEIEREYHS